MKWLTRTKLGRFALVFGIVLAVLFLLSYGAHLHSSSSVEAYKQQLRAAGEKLTIAELIPPRVPADKNGADIFEQASGLLNLSPSLLETNLPPAMRSVVPGRAVIGWQQPDIYDFFTDDTTNSWEEAGLALAQYDGALQLLYQLVDHPMLNFDLDYQKGFEIKLSHLAKMKRSAQLLSAAAVCDLRGGNAGSALTNVRTVLAIAKGSGDERILITQLVRFAVVHLALSASWELLQSPGLTDDQLAALQKDWMELEFLHALENACLMERVMNAAELQHLRESHTRYQQMTAPIGGPSSGSSSGNWLDDLGELPKEVWQSARRRSSEEIWRNWWSYADELRNLQGSQVLIDTIRQVSTNGFFRDALAERDRRIKVLGLDPAVPKPNWLRSKLDDTPLEDMISIGSLEKTLNKLIVVEVAREFATTAIALKRYQLKHGSWPDDLSALVPGLLPTVPRDPVDGQPLRYHRNSDGTFELYSIGEDGIDGGGDSTPVKTSLSYYWYMGRDWVWPRSITLPELQVYNQSNAASLSASQKNKLEHFIDHWTSAAGPGP